jgi:DNA-directed RNA polymerase specialized sigma24 family protein
MTRLPKGIDEEALIQIINRVANKLARKFRFGYHGVDDMKQQARMIAWQSLDKWDGIRSLETFLWACVHNGLFNYKRDNFERPDNPCYDCVYATSDKPTCRHYEDLEECPSYGGWISRNTLKRNLMTPIELDDVKDSREKHMKLSDASDDVAEANELRKLIDRHLPVQYRHDFLKMLNGIKVSKPRKTQIQQIIREILEENGYDETCQKTTS